MLVLAGLILTAAVIVSIALVRIPTAVPARPARPPRHFVIGSLRRIAGTPYLRFMAALVFLAAVTTQWTAFQLSVAADQRFGGDADALTKFFGTFNFSLGAVSFVLQLLLVGPALRKFGLAVTILILPIALGTGSLLVLLLPTFLSVLTTNALDQGLRFSLDKATYELLYLPLTSAQRVQVKNAIDIVISRFADSAGAVLLGIATNGFLMIGGFRLGLRGTAAINLGIIGAWTLVAARLRGEYVRTIQSSIHRHRIDTEQLAEGSLDRSAAGILAEKLASSDPEDVSYALGLLEGQGLIGLDRHLRALLQHEDANIRRRALAILSAARDTSISRTAMDMRIRA